MSQIEYNTVLPADYDGQKTTAIPIDQTANATWVTPVHIASSGVQMPVDIQNSIAYDATDDMMKVRSMQKKWKTDFGGTSLDTSRWTLVQTGSGMTVTVSGGELTIATGVTASAETIIMSNEMFTIPFKAMFGFYISQKIANQEFYMEAVSVDPTTGQPDGKDLAAWRISGTDSTTTTYGVYQVNANNIGIQSSGSSSINTVTSYAIAEMELFEDEVWFHSRQMDSANGRNNSYVKHQNIPNPMNYFKIRLRAKNGTTAPASTTNFKFQFVNVADYAELTAEITAGRGNAALGQAIGVNAMSVATHGVQQSTGNDGYPWNVSLYPGYPNGRLDYARSQGNLEFSSAMRNVTPLKGVDTPVWQYMRYSPVATGNGVCMATDPRGASRYIYIFYSTSSFWRYDIYTDTYQQLASPGALGSSGTAGGTGTCMRYDTSKGYVWLLLGATTTVGFGYYNIATDTWTTSTSPTGASSYDYQLVHTDSTVNAAGNDDYLYLAGNGATTFKRYSISGNAWTTLTAMPATPGNGCMGFWGYTQDPNLLYFFRGNATSTLYTYSISAGTWATPTIRPTIETYNTGSCGTYIADKNMYVLQKDNTHRCYAFNLATNEIEPFGYIPYVAGTNVTGDKMVNVKTPDGSQFVYYHRQSGQEMFRNMVYWY